MLTQLEEMRLSLVEHGVSPQAIAMSPVAFQQLETECAGLLTLPAAPGPPQVLGMRIYLNAALPPDTVYMADQATIRRMLGLE